MELNRILNVTVTFFLQPTNRPTNSYCVIRQGDGQIVLGSVAVTFKRVKFIYGQRVFHPNDRQALIRSTPYTHVPTLSFYCCCLPDVYSVHIYSRKGSSPYIWKFSLSLTLQCALSTGQRFFSLILVYYMHLNILTSSYIWWSLYV